MTSTPNLSLPFVMPQEVEKEVTVNDALTRLDAVVQLSVLAIQNAPPGSPAEGQRWIVGPTPTGAWAGRANAVAAYYAGWRFLAPQTGWYAYVQSASSLYSWSGAAWVEGTGGARFTTDLIDWSSAEAEDGDVPIWDAATSKFVPGAPPSGGGSSDLGSATDVDVSGAAPGKSVVVNTVSPLTFKLDTVAGGGGGGGGGPDLVLTTAAALSAGVSIGLGGMSISDHARGPIVTVPADIGVQRIRGRVFPITGHFRLTALLRRPIRGQAYHAYGLTFHDAGANAFHHMGWIQAFVGGAPMTKVEDWYWSSPSGITSVLATATLSAQPAELWQRLSWDGTAYRSEISYDKDLWNVVSYYLPGQILTNRTHAGFATLSDTQVPGNYADHVFQFGSYEWENF